jgi:hypothetical protein
MLAGIMATEPAPISTTTTALPAAPAPAAPATPSAPSTVQPSQSQTGERQAALDRMEHQRRLDRGPRLKGEGDPAAPDAPAGATDTVKLGDREYSRVELDGLEARAALEASRKLTKPAEPNGYKADFPPDFKLPEGLEFKINERDPLLAQYRTLAHELDFDQATFSRGLGVVGMVRAQEAIALREAYSAEVKKLGAAAPQRVDACAQFLMAYGGPKAKTLANMFKMAPVADTVEAIEHLMQRVSSQGVSPFNNAHRADEPNSGRIPGYDRMSFEQRREAQDRLAARRQGR